MTKVSLSLLSLFFSFSVILLACAGPVDRSFIYITPEDYGAISGDSTYDCGPAFQRMLADARAYTKDGRHVTIELGEGVYHVYPDSLERHELFISNHDHVAERPVAFYVDSIDHLSIIGRGNARLLFHGRQIPFVIRRSTGVSLEGFRIDYPRPAISQIEVLSVDSGAVRARVIAETKYRVEGNRFVLEGEGYDQQLFVCMPFGADRHMKWGRADVSFDPREIERGADGILTLRGWGEAPYLHVGDRYVLRSYYRPTPGIVLMDAEDILLKEVHVHYAEGMALVAQNTRDVSLHGFRVDVPEGSDRYFTTQADATHFSGCRGVIVSCDGLYEHMADDAINVHGTYLRVDSIVDASTMVATFAHNQSFGYTWYEEGDTLRLIDRRTLLPLTGELSAKVEQLNSTQLLVSVLSEGFDAATLKGRSVAIENVSATPEVDFENNTVRNNRARGALFSTPRRVLCADNLFDHTHGSAILLCGDANGWYESGPCYDITIRGNRFLNALTAMYQFTNGIISIDPEIPEMTEGQYYHGRVVVEGNTFETFPSPHLYAESVAELLWRDNRVVMNADFAPLFSDQKDVVVNVGKCSISK